MSKEKERNKHEKTLNETQIRNKNDIERIKIELNHIEQEYEVEIKKLNNTLMERTCRLEKE